MSDDLKADLERRRKFDPHHTAPARIAALEGCVAGLEAERDALQARYEELSLKIGVDAGREYVRALRLQARIDAALELLAAEDEATELRNGLVVMDLPSPAVLQRAVRAVLLGDSTEDTAEENP